MTTKLITLLSLLAVLSGCAQTRYAWEGYDDKLYSYYKTPAESEQFLEAIHEVIQEGDAAGKVPPGLYAEYGYLLFERGQFPEAINWFRKERDKWSESSFFMDKMIALANNRKTSTEVKQPESLAARPMEQNKEKQQ